MTQWRTTECGICSGPAGRGLLSAVLSTLALQGHIGRAGGGPEAGSSHRDHPEPVRVHSRKPGRAGVGSPGPCVDGNERWGLGQLWGWALGVAASSLGDRVSPCSLCGHHSGGDGCPCPVHEWPPPQHLGTAAAAPVLMSPSPPSLAVLCASAWEVLMAKCRRMALGCGCCVRAWVPALQRERTGQCPLPAREDCSACLCPGVVSGHPISVE